MALLEALQGGQDASGSRLEVDDDDAMGVEGGSPLPPSNLQPAAAPSPRHFAGTGLERSPLFASPRGGAPCGSRGPSPRESPGTQSQSFARRV
jgi:hypothetical protein